MARKPNYNFEKRQKDLARQKKALKKDAQGNDIPESEEVEGTTDGDQESE